ncbi:MAG: phage tail assembly protein [Alphaproteobacteria bacterium]|jgi:hypothetical protein|nr:phage tail assembly protein [Alphaproteobacteria bacterium]
MQTLKLEYTITVSNQTYRELKMRRSKVKDRLAVSNMKNVSSEEKEIRLFANLCDVSPDVIKELDENDYAELQKVYMGFFNLEETSEEK